MDIARRNAGKNGIDIILSGTNNSTGNSLGSVLSQEKDDYGGEHGYGSRMKSRRCKYAYQN